MKNLKEILVLFGAVTALLFSNVGFTEEAAAPTGTALGPAVKRDLGSVVSGASGSVTVGVNSKSAEMVAVAYGVGTLEELQPIAARVEAEINSLRSITDEAAFFQKAGELAQNHCAQLASKASECCGSPDACKSGAISGIKKAAPWIGLIGGVMAAFGGEGGAANCLAALPGIAEGLSQSGGVSKACNILNNGGSVQHEGGSAQVLGVKQTCGAIMNSVNAFVAQTPAGQTAKTQVVSQIRQLQSQASAKLQADETKAAGQAEGMQTAMGGATQCAQGLMAGDEVADGSGDPIAAIDCGNSSDAAANPSVCQGYGGVNGGSDGILGKTSGFDLATTSGAEDLADDDVAPGPENGTPIDTPLGSAAAAAKTTSAGGLGSGSGSGGAQQKAGRRRGAGKSKKLVAGYKTSRGGSSGSSGSRSPSAFKGFKNKFKFKKKKDKKDKAALAALSKLVKAGISPDQSGSIFERVSNRFAATTTKENLFDCKRNKKLWMEK